MNDDGSALGLLASWQYQSGSMGLNLVEATNNPEKVNMYLANQKSMIENKDNGVYGAYVQQGIKAVENQIDEARTLYMNSLNDAKDAIGIANDIDAIAVIAAAIAMNNKDLKDIVEKYRKAQTDIGGSQNVALIWTAMVSSVDIVKMYIEGTLDDYIAQNKAKDDSSSSGSSSSSSSTTKTKTIPKPKNTIEQITIKETNLVFQEGTGRKAMGQPDKITIHHLGGGFDHSAELIHDYEMKSDKYDHRGITYHFVIRWDGTIERGRPEADQGPHTLKYNPKNLGICVSGTWMSAEAAARAKAQGGNGGHPEPSDAQIKSLIGLLADLCKRYNLQPTEDVIKGHYTWYGEPVNEDLGCPGYNLQIKLPDIIKAVANGTYGNTKESILWTEAIPSIIEGCKLKGTINLDNLGLFPKICCLYVNLMNDAVSSSFTMADTGWAFPFKDEQVRNFPEPLVVLTGLFGEDRTDHKHEGVDLQPGGTVNRYDLNIDVYAMKAGTVYTDQQWCNGVYILHNDGTWSRYLHLKQRLVKQGQQVAQGESIGYIGGHDGKSNTAYAYHLHVEAGTQKKGEGTPKSETTPFERAFGTYNTGFDLCEKWKPTNSEVGGRKCWKLES